MLGDLLDLIMLKKQSFQSFITHAMHYLHLLDLIIVQYQQLYPACQLLVHLCQPVETAVYLLQPRKMH